MTQPLLSILIPTVVGREKLAAALRKRIIKQFEGEDSFMYQLASSNSIIGRIGEFGLGEIEILDLRDDKTMTIGEKRERLYQSAKGLFSWQIDDDDDISPNAIQLILEAIKSNPDIDIISFEEYVNIDGKEFKSNHSGAYSGWEGEGHIKFPDGFHFHRTPFFKSVIRTELAKSVPIQKIRFGEDHAFANDLHPLIKSEIHISEPLYRYIHISSPHNERYGIK